ncbi:hypothetical protein BUALT_Bualt03G0179200 [Buddleja alternifolia]|uniref:Ribosomal protein L20 n=1 Tax=Buddleja alternifolia TaxID=168488 RepID=A0AAV6Y1B7_9LAMI|nr:hypothetical protein BUALT_Bualt03G0179200 [Buddleja alternifolia]
MPKSKITSSSATTTDNAHIWIRAFKTVTGFAVIGDLSISCSKSSKKFGNFTRFFNVYFTRFFSVYFTTSSFSGKRFVSGVPRSFSSRSSSSSVPNAAISSSIFIGQPENEACIGNKVVKEIIFGLRQKKYRLCKEREMNLNNLKLLAMYINYKSLRYYLFSDGLALLSAL